MFSYKGFNGTVRTVSNSNYEGEVVGLKFNNTYEAATLSQLEEQFKNRVEHFYESCVMLGVEPEIIGRNKASKWPLFVLISTAFFIVSYICFYYLNEIPIYESGNGSKPDVSLSQKIKWLDGFGSFFNNFAAPVLSFLSFIGLLWTIYKQSESHQLSLKELALTREELELTRKEIEKTTIANQEQADALKQQVDDARSMAEQQQSLAELQRESAQLQQFENTFYSLLSEHNKMLDSIASNEFLNKLVHNERGAHRTEITKNRMELLADHDVCRYYRTLYQTLKFIAKNHPGNIEKSFDEKYLNEAVSESEKSYSSLVRSMLPTNVLLGLAINCYDGHDNNHAFHKYFLLIERYRIFEHLVFNSYINYTVKENTSNKEINEPNVYGSILSKYSPRSFDANEHVKETIKSLERLFSTENGSIELLEFISRTSPVEDSVLGVLVKQYNDKHES